MMRDLALSLVAHALLAAYRGACAVVETGGICFDRLQRRLQRTPHDQGRFS